MSRRPKWYVNSDYVLRRGICCDGVVNESFDGDDGGVGGGGGGINPTCSAPLCAHIFSCAVFSSSFARKQTPKQLRDYGNLCGWKNPSKSSEKSISSAHTPSLFTILPFGDLPRSRVFGLVSLKTRRARK